MTNTRACSNGRLIEIGKKTLTTKTCVCGAIRLWNSASAEIKQQLTAVKKGNKGLCTNSSNLGDKEDPN